MLFTVKQKQHKQHIKSDIGMSCNMFFPESMIAIVIMKENVIRSHLIMGEKNICKRNPAAQRCIMLKLLIIFIMLDATQKNL